MAQSRHPKLFSSLSTTPVVPEKNNPPDHSRLTLYIKHHSTRGDEFKPVYVFRILYDHVPSLRCFAGVKRHDERMPLVQSVYDWLAKRAVRLSGGTIYDDFNMLTHFFRFCDLNKYPAELTASAVSAYAQHINHMVRSRPEALLYFRGMADRFSAFLVWAGYEALALLMPKIVRKNTLSVSTSAYSDDEQAGITRDLFQVFNVLASRLKTGAPTTCPFNQPVTNWDISPTNHTHWFNKLTVTALFLTANFTGDNNTPLRKMRRSDVTEREFCFDKSINLYRLVSHKGRQNGQENQWNLGFTRRGRDFFHAYLECLERFDLPDDAYLFPRFIHGQYDGCIYNGDLQKYLYWFMARCPHKVRPVISRFRQSKSDGLMADTNSVTIVAEGLNNHRSTAARYYMNGNPHNNRNRLGSAAEALELTARGNTLNEARQIVEAKYGKPLRVRDIIARGEPEPAPTKTGTRCRQPFGEKALRLKQELIAGGLLGEDESVACFKFLECFGCEYQALVAETDDIWCMLSFRESLSESLQRPAVNHHLPTEKIQDVITRIQVMLAGLERDYPEIYAAALNKLNNQAHPLWDDENSVADLYEIW
ncbi:hypothetical protein [Enterobacter mori]|uniref:hypothetical protein n=1 Tax=Enterobacter mori TaxID=539813 RepID=UPI003B8407E9